MGGNMIFPYLQSTKSMAYLQQSLHWACRNTQHRQNENETIQFCLNIIKYRVLIIPLLKLTADKVNNCLVFFISPVLNYHGFTK